MREATISALTQGHTSTATLLVDGFGDLKDDSIPIFDAAILAENLEIICPLCEKSICVTEQSLVLAVRKDKLPDDKNKVSELLIEECRRDINTKGMLATAKALRGNEVDLESARVLFKAGVHVDEYLSTSCMCCKRAGN